MYEDAVVSGKIERAMLGALEGATLRWAVGTSEWTIVGALLGM